jgi:hypothetical protein
VRNTVSVWNEFAADRHGVGHARIVIVLILGARRKSRELKQAKDSKSYCVTGQNFR